MKAIMISIKPKYCVLEMNGVKSIEVRKNKALATAIQKLIDENGFADIYVCCTRDKKGQLHYSKEYGAFYDIYKGPEHYSENGNLNGKVLFKFRCYKVERIIFGTTVYNDLGFFTGGVYSFDLYKQSCLTKEEMRNYLKVKLKGLSGCAIHISDLEIFDKPKELIEFRRWVSYKKCQKCLFKKYYGRNPCLEMKTLNKAPQNFCYVEVE